MSSPTILQIVFAAPNGVSRFLGKLDASRHTVSLRLLGDGRPGRSRRGTNCRKPREMPPGNRPRLETSGAEIEAVVRPAPEEGKRGERGEEQGPPSHSNLGAAGAII